MHVYVMCVYIIFFLTHCTIYYVVLAAVDENPKWTVAAVVLNNIQSEDVYSIVRARNQNRASTEYFLFNFFSFVH